MGEQGGQGSTSVTGAQSLVTSLEAAGVTDIFGIPGGAILPAYDPLMDSTRIRHILVRHEQGAGHAAQGYAAATGRVGVCMATSGPGATNLVTPLADAHMDSVPMVAVTGQVGAAMIGTDAFQEADIRGITMPVTKHNFLVTDPARHPAHDRRGVPHRLDRAPRPGAGRHRQVGAPGDDHLRLADRAAPARLPPRDHAARQADQGGGPADQGGPPPGALRRRRRHPRPRLARAGPARRAHRHPGRHDPDGPRRLPRQQPAAPRHAGHARHGRRGRRPAEERPDHQPGRPLRRPRDGQPRLLRPQRPGDPRRHRPGRDRQEPPRGRADRR